jgi:ribosomal small subunit protein bTHX
MGRGDKRTFRGKLWRGSYGKSRSKKKVEPVKKVETAAQPKQEAAQ